MITQRQVFIRVIRVIRGHTRIFFCPRITPITRMPEPIDAGILRGSEVGQAAPVNTPVARRGSMPDALGGASLSGGVRRQRTLPSGMAPLHQLAREIHALLRGDATASRPELHPLRVDSAGHHASCPEIKGAKLMLKWVELLLAPAWPEATRKRTPHRWGAGAMAESPFDRTFDSKDPPGDRSRGPGSQAELPQTGAAIQWTIEIPRRPLRSQLSLLAH